MRIDQELKAWPSYFAETCNGRKMFDVRKSDRSYTPGDTVRLREFVPCSACRATGRMVHNDAYVPCPCLDSANPKGRYTGNAVDVEICCVLHHFEGLEPGYCVLGYTRAKP